MLFVENLQDMNNILTRFKQLTNKKIKVRHKKNRQSMPVVWGFWSCLFVN